LNDGAEAVGVEGGEEADEDLATNTEATLARLVLDDEGPFDILFCQTEVSVLLSAVRGREEAKERAEDGLLVTTDEAVDGRRRGVRRGGGLRAVG